MNQQSLLEYSQYARVLLGQKNWSGAANIGAKLRDAFSSSPEGFFIGGIVAKRTGQLDVALNHFEKAITLDAARYDAAIELAELYFSANRFGDCLNLLDTYEDKLGNSSLYLLTAAKVFSWLGLHERAWKLLIQADKVQPESDAILAKVAECAVLLGQVDIAEPIYQRLIKKYPHYQKHHYEYAKLKRVENDQHICQMKGLLSQSQQTDQNNIYLYYALGKELEDLGEWKDAFEYYEKAGAAVLKTTNYTVDTDTNTIDTITRLCTKEWLEENGESSVTSLHANVPVFIVGLPRTGTTLIERVLASHNSIESADETLFFPSALNHEVGINRFTDVDAGMIERSIDSNLNSVANRYLEMVQYRLEGKPFFIDKYPFNFLLLGFIAKAFPTAKIIHLNRHPMDACFAMFKQSYFKYSYSLDDLGKYYVAYDKLKKHWRDVLGDRIINVSYEEFVSQPEQATRNLLEDLGLEFDSACLDFHLNPKASASASTLQVREAAHTRSVNKWTNFSEQLSELKQYLSSHDIANLDEFKIV